MPNIMCPDGKYKIRGAPKPAPAVIPDAPAPVLKGAINLITSATAVLTVSALF